jgi:anti-sigma B factor antagonist
VGENFTVEVQSENRAAWVLAVTGELDLASSPALEQELERANDAGAKLIVVDLRGLAFMDSTGLHVLVKAHKRARDAGRRFALVQGGKQIQRLLSLTGLDEKLTVADSPEELLSAG